MSIERFIVAVESIAASLAIMAGNRGTTAPAAAPEGKTEPAAKPPGRPRKETKVEPAAAPTTTVHEAKPGVTPAAQEPTFDYELTKKAIIALASAGAEGKQAAARILAEAGVEPGKKASDAHPSKWEGMRDKAVAALEGINAGSDFT